MLVIEKRSLEQRVFEIARAQGAKRKAIAAALGKSESTIAGIYAGDSLFRAADLPILADLLKVNIDDIFGRKMSYNANLEVLENVNIPLLTTQKGQDKEVGRMEIVRGSVTVPANLGRDGSMGFVIPDDTMMPFLEASDIAVFSEAVLPRPGYVHLIYHPSEGLTVAIIVWDRASASWQVKPANPSYPTFPMGAWKVQGLLTGYYRKKGSETSTRCNFDGLTFDFLA